MRAALLASAIDEPLVERRYRLLGLGGMTLAIVFSVMSLAGLLLPATYARETPAWIEQALAQDWFDLVVAAPVLVVSASSVARGSRHGLLVLAGTLLFSVYTAVIYAFAVHFNALFLVYCTALGISLYTLAGTCARLWEARGGLEVSPQLPRRSAGAFLVAIGVMFGLLWLAQIAPATVAGAQPTDLTETGLLTNPVHVLDLSFVLPLHVIAGIALWRMRSALVMLAPVVLVFDALMAASIATLAAYSGSLGLTLVMGALALASTAISALVVRALLFKSAGGGSSVGR